MAEKVQSVKSFLQMQIQEHEVQILLIDDNSKVRSTYSLFYPDFTENTSFCVADLLLFLKKNGNDFENCLVFWLFCERNQFIFLGKYPISHDMCINFENQFNKKIILKFRAIKAKEDILTQILHQHQSEKETSIISPESYNAGFDDSFKISSNCSSSSKESEKNNRKILRFDRKIGIIIKKCAIWRKIFNNNDKIDLETAAKQVALTSKTLHYYLFQIRIGKRFGFDFNKHSNDKMRILRIFNKKAMEKLYN